MRTKILISKMYSPSLLTTHWGKNGYTAFPTILVDLDLVKYPALVSDYSDRNSSEMAETAIETGWKRSSVFEPDLRTIQAILARLAQLSCHFSQSFSAIL